MILSFFFVVSLQYDIPSDPIYTRTYFTFSSETHNLLKKRGFFFFNSKNVSSINLNYGLEKRSLSVPQFSAAGNIVDFTTKDEEKQRYFYWILEENECTGLNYLIYTHYGMKMEMKKVNQEKPICLFLPYSATSINISDTEGITTIYKTGFRQKIFPDEINSFSNPFTYPLVIVIPPKRDRTLSIEFKAEEDTKYGSCGVLPVEDFNKNDASLFKYEIPFDIKCYESGQVKLNEIFKASIVASVSGILLIIMHFIPRFFNKKDGKQK